MPIDNGLHLEDIRKNYTELIDNGIDILSERTEISDFSSGSISRSFLELFYDDIESIYYELYNVAKRSKPSTSSGVFLEELAALVNCERENEESDENLRAKIYNNPQLKAKANEEAVRYACREVNGVNNVEIKKYPRGVGSFDIYVITENPNTEEDTIEEVQKKINEVQASGIDGRAVRPNIVNIDLDLTIVFKEGTSSEIREDVRNATEDTLREHFANKKLGSDLIISEVISIMTSISPENIHDVKINRIFIDNVEAIVNNKSFDWDQRLLINNITIN